uniref:Uncharacterized protein n=1 Tax=Panagrolaimus sp. ES5 TaxID=591445 RepID=A0AC34FQB5_9BILA
MIFLGIINLTPENPTQIVFLDPLISDCPSSLTFSAPKGYTLDLYVDDNAVYGNYSLYDSQTTENFVTTLRNLPQPLEDYIPKNYESKSGFLTIAFHNNSISNSACLYIYYGVLFLRLREIHAANCLSTNNVYSMDDLQLTAKAKATGPCMLTVLNYYSTRVSLISASSPINNDQYEFIPQTNRAFPYLKFTYVFT